MAKIEFNINELFRAAFGYVALPYPLGELGGGSITGTAKAIVKGVLNKNDVFGRSYFMPIMLNGIWIPNNPVMSITATKEIKSTKIAGGDGTVKELISIDDYKIRIRGFCINFQENDYPYDDVEALRDLFSINKSIPIQSDLCEIFGINNVVIESMNFPELVGIQNVQPYEMALMSDKDFEVIIN